MTSVLPINVANGLKLDPAEARKIGESLSSDYCFAEPFPHTDHHSLKRVSE